MSSSQDNDGPPILRPIPRRPFNVNFTAAQDEEPSSQPPSPHPRSTPAMLNLDFLNSKLLNPRLHSVARGDDGTYATGSNTISRAQSVKNLTSSTLFGIYSPSTTGVGDSFSGVLRHRTSRARRYGAWIRPPRLHRSAPKTWPTPCRRTQHTYIWRGGGLHSTRRRP
ncbi:insulin-induced protein [Apiospora arundinis]